MNVGDTVFLVERSGGGNEVKITGETRSSFLVPWHGGDRRFDKKTGRERANSWGKGHLITQEEHERRSWIAKNRPTLVQDLTHCIDVEKLKQIQAILEGC